MANVHDRQLLLLAVTRNGPRQRMRGKPLQRIRQPSDVTLASSREALDLLHAQFARRERARLVHRHHRDLRQILHGRTATKKNTALRTPRDRGENGGRNRQHQRARRRHDQQRHRLVEGALRRRGGLERLAAKSEPPHEKHQRGQREDAVGVSRAELVREPLRRRFQMLRLANQMNDLLQRALARLAQHRRLDRAPQVHRTRQHRVADFLFDGRRFPSEVRFITRRRAFHDLGIDGKLFTGFDEQSHSGLQVVDWFAMLVPLGIQHDRLLWRVLEQRTNLPARPAHRVMLQRAGDREEEEQHRTLAPRTDARAANRDGEHQEMNVQRALLEQLPNLMHGEPRTRDIGEDVERQRKLRLARQPR